MDDPFVWPNTPIRLRRASECNRLEKQFLIAAYEHLVTLIVPEEQHDAGDNRIVTKDELSAEHAHASIACWRPAATVRPTNGRPSTTHPADQA